MKLVKFRVNRLFNGKFGSETYGTIGEIMMQLAKQWVKLVELEVKLILINKQVSF